jgi:hypothetical protein
MNSDWAGKWWKNKDNKKEYHRKMHADVEMYAPVPSAPFVGQDGLRLVHSKE